MTAGAGKPPAREPMFLSGLLNVAMLAILLGGAVAAWILFAHDGLRYYLTPLAVRGYDPAHRFLRPSGFGGHLLGVVGTLFLVLTLLYPVRKRVRALSRRGSPMHWLEFHIFCGVFGPILVTLHTSFKFNGIISVAYWSMVIVVLSGFVGRYLFVRIPKTIRGTELSRAELEQNATDIRAQIAATSVSPQLLAELEKLDEDAVSSAAMHGLAGFRSRLAYAAELRRFRDSVAAQNADPELIGHAVTLLRERAVLLRRIANLKRTRELFHMWHVFHRPLVWVMFAIFSIHLAVAVYFGYTLIGR